MTDDSDPVRLAEAKSSASARMRELLAESKTTSSPSDEQLQQLSMRLAPLLWPGPGGGGGAPTGGGASTGVGGAAATGAGAKVTAGVLIASLIGGGVWMASGTDAPKARAPAETKVEAPALERSDKAAQQGPAPEIAPPAEEPAAAPEAPVPTTLAPKPAPRHRDEAKVPPEAELLFAAKAALAKDPGKTLRLIEEHRRRYPSGVLGQEREVLAIAALKRLGKESEAAKQAEQFKRKYPNSAHGSKVDDVVRER